MEANAAVKGLSGPQWARRFKGSTDTSDLSGSFRVAVDEFLAAMRQAGMKVVVSSTLRPIKRSYLMHRSWRIAEAGFDPALVPPLAGVGIEWQHAQETNP